MSTFGSLRVWPVLAGMLLCLGASAVPIAGPPPPNDNFANAINATSTPFTDSQDISGATTEPGEPVPPTTCVVNESVAKTHSIWYTFTAPTNGTINADTEGSNYDTILQVGTAPSGLSSFSLVACNDDARSGVVTSAISFSATARTKYFFMVSSFSDVSAGLAVFHLSFTLGAPSPDLAMSKTHSGNFNVGANGIYNMTVTNVGTASTSSTFTVTDPLPSGLGFVSAGGGNWVCSASGQSVTCLNNGPLAIGASTAFNLTVSVGPAAAPSVTNRATVFLPGDTNPSNNTASDVTPVTALVPALTSISPNKGNVGQTLTLTLNGTNFNSSSAANFGSSSYTGGLASADGTVLAFSIPGTQLSGVGTVAVSVTNPPPGGGTSSPQTFTISDFAVSSLSGQQTINAGQAATFTIAVGTQGGALANDLSLSVTGLPAASTGAFTPASFAAGSNGGNSTFTVATTARSAVPPQAPRPPVSPLWFWLVAAVLALASRSLLRQSLCARRLAPYLPLALLLVLSAAFILGCGAGGGDRPGPAPPLSGNGTPAGTYTITVTATSGGVARLATAFLKVN